MNWFEWMSERASAVKISFRSHSKINSRRHAPNLFTVRKKKSSKISLHGILILSLLVVCYCSCCSVTALLFAVTVFLLFQQLHCYSYSCFWSSVYVCMYDTDTHTRIIWLCSPIYHSLHVYFTTTTPTLLCVWAHFEYTMFQK